MYFADAKRLDKLDALSEVSDKLRDRFGRDVIYPARLKSDLFLTHEKVTCFTDVSFRR